MRICNFLYAPHIDRGLYVAQIENLHIRIQKMVIFCVYMRERAKKPPNSEAYTQIEKNAQNKMEIQIHKKIKLQKNPIIWDKKKITNL